VAAAYAAAAFLVNSAFELSSLWFRLYGHYEKKIKYIRSPKE
jgi:hypothetical protein